MKCVRWLRCLLFCGLCLAFPTLMGCVAGGREEKTVHIFVGDTPQAGAVQVATNKPIPVISVDPTGATHYEERDCGEFVLYPPHYHREVRKAVEERNELLKRYNELVSKYNELLSRSALPGAKGAPTGREPVTLDF